MCGEGVGFVLRYGRYRPFKFYPLRLQKREIQGGS